MFSFQAEPDVERLLLRIQRLGYGEKTRQINQAIRLHHREAAVGVLRHQIASLQARLADLETPSKRRTKTAPKPKKIAKRQ